MKSSKNNTLWIIIFGVIIVGVTLIFILGNGLLDYDASHKFSQWFVRLLGMESKGPGGDGDLLLRKIAHVVEYALLGTGVFILTKKLNKTFGKNLFGFALFYSLAVSVLDEYFQSFSARTSSVRDVILDFCGVLSGFLIGYIILKIVCLIKRKSRKGKEDARWKTTK